MIDCATIKRSAFALLLACAGMFATSHSQAGESWPLFESEDTLPVTLELAWAELKNPADPETPLTGNLTYKDGATPNSLDLEITTRGHSRRELCDVPPLKLNFRRDQLQNTVFEGQNKLKLVTHCQKSKRFYRYIDQEYALYKTYNALTDASFRVRMLSVTYRDTGGGGIERERPAFFIESDREVAQRLAMIEVETAEVATSTLEPEAITLLGLWQFMIGNTDWSLLKGRGSDACCHNGLLLRNKNNQHLIVPYDFDQAGLINVHYALPAEGLKIRSVRQRLFRGLCTGDDRLLASLTLIRERRPLIEAAFPLKGANKRANQRARKYIDDFYGIADSDKERQQRISQQCRGNPEWW
jgi:hypothetical protein